MDNNEDIVERLRRHYDDVPEPASAAPNNPEFEKLVGQLVENPETFRKVTVKGLNGIKGRSSRPTRHRRPYGRIHGSDLGDDSRLVEADPVLSYVAVQVPAKILKKLKIPGASEGTTGVVINREFFKANSRFSSDGLESLILWTGESGTDLEHEKWHIRYDRYNRSKKYVLESLEKEINGSKKRTECIRLISIGLEHHVLSEILARGISKKNEKLMSIHEKKAYAGYFAKSFVNKMDGLGIYDLPDVDKRILSKLVRNKMAGHYMQLFNAGLEAFSALYRNLPEETVIGLVLDCGPKGGPIESGKYPVEEFVERSKNYKKVLGAGQGGQ